MHIQKIPFINSDSPEIKQKVEAKDQSSELILILKASSKLISNSDKGLLLNIKIKIIEVILMKRISG